MPVALEQFVRHLTESGLLTADEVAQIRGQVPPDKQDAGNADEFARELVRQKKLTKFQAEQIYAGKGSSLTLGNYVILDKLGQGGMGMVLKAWHRRMERTVALKVINPKVVKDPVALKRFQREVVAAAKLTHPNIVAAHDADEAKGTHFLVMEYVEGSDLSGWVKQFGPMPVEQAVNCIAQAARGLAYAHEQGVVHRDIKPHNLLLDAKGTVKILDMGLDRIEAGVGGSAEHADLTNSGAMMGTVDYMAPEQAMDSKHADARSDIYSLGCTLFFLMTGHATFVADTMMKRLTAHQNAAPPSLAEEASKSFLNWHGGASVSSGGSSEQLAALNAVFQRMVAKRPADRFQSMSEVIAALEQCRSAFGAGGDGATTSDIALQSFLRDITGEGSSATRTGATGPQRTAVLPEANEATIVESQFSRDTDATLHETIAREANASNLAAKKSSRGVVIAGVLVTTLLLAVGFFAMRGPSGTLHLEVGDELTQVTVGETGHVVKGTSEQDLRLPVGEYVLHVEREKLAFDTDPFELTKSKTVSIKVERVGRAVRAMAGKTVLGRKEETKATTSSDRPGAKSSQAMATDRERAALDWLFSIGAEVLVGNRYGAIRVQSTAEALASKQSVANISLDGLAVSDADLGKLLAFPEIYALRIDGEAISDAGIARIAELPNLQVLAINRTSVTDRGLEAFLKHRSLDGLELDKNQLTVECLKTIAQLPRLNLVTLYEFPVTDESLVEFQKLPNLKHLSLVGSRVTDAGLVEFSKIPKLTHLWLGRTQLTDACGEKLAGLSGLEELYLTSTAIGNRVAEALPALTHLTALNLSETKITDEAIPHVSRMKSLQSLNVTSTALTADGVKRLVAALPQCLIWSDHGNFPPSDPVNGGKATGGSDREVAEWVINNGGDVSLVGQKAVLAKVADLPREPFNIGRVQIRKGASFTAADGQRLAQLPELTTVEFMDSTISDGAIRALAGCRRLSTLNVRTSSVSDTVLSEIHQLSQLRVLELLSLSVTDDFVAGLGQLRHLQDVNLFGCPKVSDEGLVRMVAAPPPKLQGLSLQRMKIGAAAMKAVSKLTHLQDLRLREIPLNDEAIAELESCPTLSRLQMFDVAVSGVSVSKLQKALANCQILGSDPRQATPLYDMAYRDAIRRLMTRGFQILVESNRRGGQTMIQGDEPIPAGDVVVANGVMGTSPPVLDPTPEDLKSIAQIADLRILFVTKLPPGSRLSDLATLQNLTTLNVMSAPLSDADIAQLSAFRKLSKLSVIVPNDATLEAIARLPHLSDLRFHLGTKVTAAGLKALESAPVLSQLTLDPATALLPAAQAFANARPDVIVLDAESKRLDPLPPKNVSPPPAKAPFNAQQARAHQEAWAKHLGTSVETTNSVGAKMILIPPGEFLMGSTDEQVAAALKMTEQTNAPQVSRDDIQITEQPQHRVILTKPFRLAATEVTIAQFQKFTAATGYNTEAVAASDPQNYRAPGHQVTDDCPAMWITWNDAVAYCQWLSQVENTSYRLPTEAEWEFACRAGTLTQFWFGDDHQGLEETDWFVSNSRGGRSRPVGTKQANPFGLHDMHGNTSEWCSDHWERAWYLQSPLRDPIGPDAAGLGRSVRGGNWYGHASFCRSARRSVNLKSYRNDGFGFRVLQVLDTVGSTNNSATNSKTTRPTVANGVVPQSAIAPFNAQQARAYQEAWSKHLGTAVKTTNCVGANMILIPPGEFLMGSTPEQIAVVLKQLDVVIPDSAVIKNRVQASESPQHRVTLSKPFLIGATEVTVGQFRQFVDASQYVTEAEKYGFGNSEEKGSNAEVNENLRGLNWKSSASSDDVPVVQVSWNDAQAYCQWLSIREKATYRLPTEAEWEYACRAGSNTQFAHGDDDRELGQYAWLIGNANSQLHPVAGKLPNAFGLHDMHGNVMEWCGDFYDQSWYSQSPSNDPRGPITGKGRVLRGGVFDAYAVMLRSAARLPGGASKRHSNFGFRVVQEIELSSTVNSASGR